jgi:uncharacterized protein YbbC (DUF1343 family)/CubicO group peptidase (beta-lactamase class C family)
MKFGFAGMIWLLLAGMAGAGEFYEDRLAAMDSAVKRSIAQGGLPGGVLWLERKDTTHARAFGSRALVPKREPMTPDTVFDAASLTKVVATTPAVMKLVEQGRIDLEKEVAAYLPEFAGDGRERIRVRHLLTHVSGLRAGISVQGDWTGIQGAYEMICVEKPKTAPGSTYLYSDINFILLGILVERVSGKALDVYCEEEIFVPLKMTETRFLPLRNTPVVRIAPTERLPGGKVLRGEVHDPTARKMGGVAGHAGLFTTAADLARFARMMLGGVDLAKTRVFKPESVAMMTRVSTPDGVPRRGLGWDIDSPYTGLRGMVFPVGGFGHTGWTGTSLWIDPYSETFLVFLSNRNHPRGGNVLPLQAELGTLAAQAVRQFNMAHVPGALPADPGRRPIAVPVTREVWNGIDVLKRDDFSMLQGMKVGLVTNHTGLDRERGTSIDALHEAPGVELVALFSPEHGIRGELDREKIADGKDMKTGLPVYSLYGERRSPDAVQLKDLDALVFDIQDIGCRFYTYISTMVNCMAAAAENGVEFVVLDRVNPIGSAVEGPVLSVEPSFVGIHPIPIRHGMTVGELAMLVNAERKLGADLVVVKCEGGPPLQWFDRTGLPWRDPSPNMRSLTAALLYPGVGMLEFCRISVGRGTGTPFELLGAPYMDDRLIAAEMNAAGLAGVVFVPVRFTPEASVFANEECGGVRIIVTDRDSFRPVELGLVLATTLHRIYGKEFEAEKMIRLLGDQATLDGILSGKPTAAIRDGWTKGLLDFERRRKDFLIYQR